MRQKNKLILQREKEKERKRKRESFFSCCLNTGSYNLFLLKWSKIIRNLRKNKICLVAHYSAFSLLKPKPYETLCLICVLRETKKRYNFACRNPTASVGRTRRGRKGPSSSLTY